MIELLRIRNLALIEDMELEFSPGYNVLTGETGAGKSFILKAIGFLTGEKMPGEYVRPGAEKAVVEAVFSLAGEEFLIRRELIVETGRSRLYVNGDLAARETVLELRPRLISLASQQAQLKLLQPSFQAGLLDVFLPDASLIGRKDALLGELAQLRLSMGDLQKRRDDLEARREFLEHQQAEIAKVAPSPGEEEALLARRALLKDFESVRRAVDGALSVLHGEQGALAESVGLLERELAALSARYPEFADWREQAQNFKHGLGELSRGLRKLTDLNEDAGEAEAIEARLFGLAQLTRRLKRSMPEIFCLSREIEENLAFLDNSGLDLRDLARREAAKSSELAGVLADLNAARRAAAPGVSARIEGELAGLGFAQGAKVLFEFTPKPAYAPLSGDELAEDKARLLWLPNPGQPPLPLDKIASGGELSRFLLAVTGLLAEEGGAALVFDEIDAGIGGLTLDKVAGRLAKLSGGRQVIVITHWPQIAAGAARHFLVEKVVRDGVTATLCRRLSSPEVFDELSRMAGGGRRGEAVAGELTGKAPGR
ncbi:MAG: AAA family ATPase [Desulfovibrionaceae bacterium]|nr:AAA family ATPase [Desulfovibrionaceae bacterium]MBF0514516.1 AAA family ATPase [Desulfovibrionaceae bacterium]